MRTFRLQDGKSDKFWYIELKGTSFTVTFGRTGTKGQTQTKTFADAARAQKEHDKLVKEKLAKGYEETTPPAPPPVAPLQAALEAALVENPDDTAAHMAYADYLQEQGDPRGEFSSVQLALEDPGKSPKERKALQKREAALLAAHQRAWLGELAPELLGDKPVSDWRRQHNKISSGRWARGWLGDLYLWNLELPLARVLARAPAARLLRRLHVELSDYESDYETQPGDDIPQGSEYPCLYPFRRASFLPCLRVFQLGETVDFSRESYNCRTSGEGVVDLIAQMSRLEELYLLTHGTDTARVFGLPNLGNLRVLQVYHEEDYPLEVLARNKSLGRLTHLLLHPRHSFPREGAYLRRDAVRALVRSPHLPALTHLHLHASDLGDAGCKDIVASGILQRLKVLDLGFGCVGDEGARTLAACPDVRRLVVLSLEHNELTDEGRQVLQGLGIDVRCEHQSEPGSEEYLYSGDME
jgi:uncharacterized protein (TIGR02996 family)